MGSVAKVAEGEMMSFRLSFCKSYFHGAFSPWFCGLQFVFDFSVLNNHQRAKMAYMQLKFAQAVAHVTFLCLAHNCPSWNNNEH